MALSGVGSFPLEDDVIGRARTLVPATLLGAAFACNDILGNPDPNAPRGLGGVGGLGGDDASGGMPSSGGANSSSSGGTAAPSDGGTGPGGLGGDSGLPTNPERRTVTCGLNDRGEQDQVFLEQVWVDEGTCDDPDECVDDSAESDAPCAAGRGVGTRVCEDGSWTATECACTEAAEEYDELADSCVVPVACNVDGSPFGGGDGVTTPHLICSPAHLRNIEAALGARFLLAESLDLGDVDDFVPLGNTEDGFTGEFDGGGRALVGLVIDRSSEALGQAENSVGLFRDYSGEIRDLTLKNFTVRGGSYVGSLAGGSFEGEVERVHVVGGLVAGEGSEIGGLSGSHASGAVLQCSSSSTVSSTGSLVGGLIGRVDSFETLFDQNSATGSVTGTNSVGGLVGQDFDVDVDRSSATGDVSGQANVGGLIGSLLSTGSSGAWDTSVTNSSASGDVSGETSVGGLIGDAFDIGIVSRNKATGSVTGTSSVGGLIGSRYSAKLTQNYATGRVTASGGELGGLCGVADGGGSFQDNYAHGLVDWVGEGAAPASVGALVGELDDLTIERSFARSHTPTLVLVGLLDSENALVDAESKTLSQASFGSQANFPTWDFVNTWLLSSELGRPILRWEVED